jgi:hypothetical protein
VFSCRLVGRRLLVGGAAGSVVLEEEEEETTRKKTTVDRCVLKLICQPGLSAWSAVHLD